MGLINKARELKAALKARQGRQLQERSNKAIVQLKEQKVKSKQLKNIVAANKLTAKNKKIQRENSTTGRIIKNIKAAKKDFNKLKSKSKSTNNSPFSSNTTGGMFN